MSECDCSSCWFCEFAYVIGAYDIWCEMIEKTGKCPYLAERKEE